MQLCTESFIEQLLSRLNVKEMSPKQVVQKVVQHMEEANESGAQGKRKQNYEYDLKDM